jgi:outer membrane protein assembly factor BamB
VLILDGTSGQDARALTALDRSSGQVLWKTKVDRQVAGWISANEKEILAELMPGTLSALALSDGKILWQSKLPEPLSVEPSAAGALIVVATSKKLLLLDRQTGTVLWTAELSQTPNTAPLLQGRRIVIGSNQGLQSYSALDGSPSTDWKAPKDHVAGNAFVATARIFAYASSKELVVLDPANGQEIARHTALPCAPVRFRGGIFFVSPRGLERLDESDPSKKPTLWSDTTWLGTPSTALISAGDGVIGGFGGWGLVRLGGSK